MATEPEAAPPPAATVQPFAPGARRGYLLRLDPSPGPSVLASLGGRLVEREELRAARVLSTGTLALEPSTALLARLLAAAFSAGGGWPSTATAGAPPLGRRVTIHTERPGAEAARLRAARTRALGETLARLAAITGSDVEATDEVSGGRGAAFVIGAGARDARRITVGPVVVRGTPDTLEAAPPLDVAFALMAVEPGGRVTVDADACGAGAASPLGRAQAFHARLASQVRYAAHGRGPEARWARDFDARVLDGEAARHLALAALELPDVAGDAARRADPSMLVRHLGVLQATHDRYHAAERIVSPEPAAVRARLVLVTLVRRAAGTLLRLLGVPAPDGF